MSDRTSLAIFQLFKWPLYYGSQKNLGKEGVISGSRLKDLACRNRNSILSIEDIALVVDPESEENLHGSFESSDAGRFSVEQEWTDNSACQIWSGVSWGLVLST